MHRTIQPLARRLPLTVAALLSLTVVLPAAAGQRQGIRGTVTIGPTCPVQREGESCVRPFATVLFLRRVGSSAAPRTLRSGTDGRFTVALAVGRYRLTPRNGKPYPRAAAQTVSVRAGRYTRVSVDYDSGIR